MRTVGFEILLSEYHPWYTGIMIKTATTQCENCNKEFQYRSAVATSRMNHNITPPTFCSRRCHYEFRGKRDTVVISCTQCNTPVKRRRSAIKKNKSGRFFCSKSCAATYNNTHKAHGTRRSKLEAYLESKLRSEFPNLEIICNGKEAIGSELDFYFPQLRLAIELNGFLHYEPIYGTDRLERIQANDQQKFIACNAADIELCIIDSSAVKHTTSVVKERYWSIVKNLVTPLLGRVSADGKI